MNAIMANKLSKQYEHGNYAVDTLSLTLEQGEIFGFLGPNGAGKTTTVKLLNGMLDPSAGICQVFGIDPCMAPEQVHKISGVVTEHAQMYDHLTGIQNLVFFGTAFGLSTSASREYAEILLRKLELSDASDKKLAAYSTGMRQRLSLARALIHRPKILFLDEPTSGLDPESTQNVNNMIRTMARDEGITVFLCTHQLRYAQEICSSYGLIDNGLMLASGRLDELRALVSLGMKVSITTSLPPEHIPYRKTGEQTVEIDVMSEEEIPSVISSLVNSGADIYHVSSRQLSLEEIYFALLEKRKGRNNI